MCISIYYMQCNIYFLFKRSLLQHCWIDSTQVFHKGSKSTGFPQCGGNNPKIHCFNWCNFCGHSAGYCLVPKGVNIFITSGPNTASLASLQASFPMLLSFLRWWFIASTVSMGIVIHPWLMTLQIKCSCIWSVKQWEVYL